MLGKIGIPGPKNFEKHCCKVHFIQVILDNRVVAS